MEHNLPANADFGNPRPCRGIHPDQIDSGHQITYVDLVYAQACLIKIKTNIPAREIEKKNFRFMTPIMVFNQYIFIGWIWINADLEVIRCKIHVFGT